MRVESRMATRAVTELLLTLAGWGAGITGVILCLLGNLGTGVVLVAEAAVAFAVSATSSRRNTTGHYAADQLNEAVIALQQGRYSEAQTAALKATEIAQSVPELRSGMSAALLPLATARAVTADEHGARQDVHFARVNAMRFADSANEFLALASLIEGELNRGVPDPERLALDVIGK